MFDHTIRRLPDSELEIMQAIWQCVAPVSRKQIEEIIADKHPMAATTLLTLLTRLAEKDFITIEKVGRSSQYTPLIGQQEYLAAQGNRFFQKLCGGSLSAFASALCDSGLSKEELAQLRELLQENEL